MNHMRVYAIFLRHFYLLTGSLTRLIPIFIWGFIDIVLWGFITRYLNDVSASGINFVPILLGAILLWDFLVRVMQGVIMTFLEDVWTRNFMNIFASPISIRDYLGGMVLSSIVTSLVWLAVIMTLAMTLFGLSYLRFGLMIAAFLLILFLTGIALGVFAAGMVLKRGPASEWLVWPIPALLSPFAGVFYPLATLPHWMQLISKTLPPSYVFEGMRGVLAGKPLPVADMLAGGGLAVLYILLSCWFFTRVYRHAVRSGLIARYSAESLS